MPAWGKCSYRLFLVSQDPSFQPQWHLIYLHCWTCPSFYKIRKTSLADSSSLCMLRAVWAVNPPKHSFIFPLAPALAFNPLKRCRNLTTLWVCASLSSLLQSIAHRVAGPGPEMADAPLRTQKVWLFPLESHSDRKSCIYLKFHLWCDAGALLLSNSPAASGVAIHNLECGQFLGGKTALGSPLPSPARKQHIWSPKSGHLETS